jgi:hypothetical protein
MPNTRIASRGQPRSHGGARAGAGRKKIEDFDDFVVLVGSEYDRLMKEAGYAQLVPEISRRKKRGETNFLLERPLGPRRQRVYPYLLLLVRSGKLELKPGVPLTAAQRKVSIKTLRRKVAAYRRLVDRTRENDPREE